MKSIKKSNRQTSKTTKLLRAILIRIDYYQPRLLHQPSVCVVEELLQRSNWIRNSSPILQSCEMTVFLKGTQHTITTTCIGAHTILELLLLQSLLFSSKKVSPFLPTLHCKRISARNSSLRSLQFSSWGLLSWLENFQQENRDTQLFRFNVFCSSFSTNISEVVMGHSPLEAVLGLRKKSKNHAIR